MEIVTEESPVKSDPKSVPEQVIIEVKEPWVMEFKTEKRHTKKVEGLIERLS